MRTVVVLFLASAVALAGGADKAQKLLDKKAYAKAEAAARKLVEADAANIDAWLVLADAMVGQADSLEGWEQQGKVSAAAEALEAIVEKQDKDALVPLKLGDLYVKLAELMLRLTGKDNDVQGYYSDAVRMYTTALERDAKSADAEYGLGYVIYFSGKGADKAREHIDKALGLNKDHAKAHALQAEIFRRDKNYTAAANSYEIARKLDDSNPLTCLYYAYSLWASGDKDGTPDAYFYTIKRHPDYAAAVRAYVSSLHKGDYTKAVPDLQKWTEKIKDSAPLWFYLGWGQSLLKQHPESYGAFEKAAKLAPQNSEYVFRMGLARESDGKADGALKLYRKALKLDGAHEMAAARFEGLIRMAGDIDKAEKLYEELIKLAPQNGLVQNNYAFILRNWAERRGAMAKQPPTNLRQRIKRSSEVYEMSAANLPDDPQIQSDTGLLFEFYPCNRDDDKAIKYFTRSLDLSKYLYRDAFDGLTRLCRRTERWELLYDYADGVVGAIDGGGHAIAPVGGSEPRELPAETPGLKARAVKAMQQAEPHLKEE
ncbi:MAG: tetratricopeptide repeat protein [Planctomycetota bacterium]